MRKIDIQITKGSIKSFEVMLKDGLPRVNAHVALFTENNKEISTFTVSTEDYYGTAKIELPPEMIIPIQEIASRLERMVINECNKSMHLIEVKPNKDE
jgi:hypothetical protein